MNEGFIKAWRRILKWEWYKEGNTIRVFMHLLFTANFKQNKWQGIIIKAGQTVTSYAKLSEETGISVQSVRTSINRLISTGEITYQSTNKYSVITICNWALYQSNDENLTNSLTSIPTNNQQTTNKQLTTNKNDKNTKNVKNTNIVSGDVISEPPIITILLNDKTEYHIYESQITQWEELYPAVDVMQNLRSMKAWCIANPKNRKTKDGVMKFVNGWLSREQDKYRQPRVNDERNPTDEYCFVEG